MNFNNPLKYCNECSKPVFTGVDHLNVHFMGLRTTSQFAFTSEERLRHVGMRHIINPKVLEWGQLNWSYQSTLPWANESEKLEPMKHIFIL